MTAKIRGRTGAARTGAAGGKADVYTVSRLAAEIRGTLLRDFTAIWIDGEISNLVVAASGHAYFSLKDHTAQIRCAMFRNRNRTIGFRPENGLQVLVYAKPDLYQPRGDLQLIVERMELAGEGELQRRFELLKKKLAAEGLFEENRKKPVPAWPRTVGIVTSEKGAALHDAITVMERRFPAVELIIYPVPVQGADAPRRICRMLAVANKRKETDVLLLIRGGGSMEDLQAFNDEAVARQIAASAIPVVSGVGHETDFTIADFVSDRRTPTPSAAAICVIPDSHAVAQQLLELEVRLHRVRKTVVDTNRRDLMILEATLLRYHPENRIRELSQQFDELQQHICTKLKNRMALHTQALQHAETMLMYNRPSSLVATLGRRVDANIRSLAAATQHILLTRKHIVSGLAAKLDSLSPCATLKRGYAIVTDAKGRIVRSTADVHMEQPVDITVENGRIQAQVSSVHPQNNRRLR